MKGRLLSRLSPVVISKKERLHLMYGLLMFGRRTPKRIEKIITYTPITTIVRTADMKVSF